MERLEQLFLAIKMFLEKNFLYIQVFFSVYCMSASDHECTFTDLRALPQGCGRATQLLSRHPLAREQRNRTARSGGKWSGNANVDDGRTFFSLVSGRYRGARFKADANSIRRTLEKASTTFFSNQTLDKTQHKQRTTGRQEAVEDYPCLLGEGGL